LFPDSPDYPRGSAAQDQEKRLVLLGHGNFKAEHEKAHALMDRLEILHEYRNGPARKHDWHSGWLAGAAELLLGK
jgi:hypothetical protein